MIESDTGIVLRLHRHSETSLIVRWLTRDAGRVSTLARGARRSKSPLAGTLDLFVEADLTFQRSRRSDLHTLREAAARNLHLPLRAAWERLTVAAYCTSLLERTTEADTPLPGFFELFTGLLEELCRSAPRPRLIFAFELKLLERLGLSPAPSAGRLNPAARELVMGLATRSWPEIQELEATAQAARELGAFLNRFLVEHIGTVPNSRVDALKAASN